MLLVKEVLHPYERECSMVRRSAFILVMASAILALAFMPNASAAPLPELEETGVSWVASPDCSQLVVRVEVTNSGTANAGQFVLGYQWSFGSEYEHLRKVFRRGLNAGASKTVTFVIPYAADELMDNIFTVDRKNQVAELDETNNETSDQDVYCFS
jgi:hypothetical protein